MPTAVHLVVHFDRQKGGHLAAGRPAIVRDRATAERRARRMAIYHVGALALSRTGNPETGVFERDEVIAAYGDVFKGAAPA